MAGGPSLFPQQVTFKGISVVTISQPVGKRENIEQSKYLGRPGNDIHQIHSHPIDPNFIIEPYLTAGEAGKCSLYLTAICSTEWILFVRGKKETLEMDSKNQLPRCPAVCLSGYPCHHAHLVNRISNPFTMCQIPTSYCLELQDWALWVITKSFPVVASHDLETYEREDKLSGPLTPNTHTQW